VGEINVKCKSIAGSVQLYATSDRHYTQQDARVQVLGLPSHQQHAEDGDGVSP